MEYHRQRVLKTMIENRALLVVLNEHEFCSDEMLATQFATTHSAINKAIKCLQSLGLMIESVAGKGYRLQHKLELLDSDVIHSHLQKGCHSSKDQLLLFDQLSSTNQLASKLVAPNQGYWSAVLSELQTAGRGRRGRTWVSPYAANIYLSMVWTLSRPLSQAAVLSPFLALRVGQCLQRLGVPDVQVKWPNDIYCDGKKVAGLLLECFAELTDSCTLVIGVGVNVSMSTYKTITIDQEWIDLLAVMGADDCLSRNQLAAELINSLFAALLEFESGQMGAWQEQWQAMDAFHGQSVSLQDPYQGLSGIARGICADGAYKVSNKEGEHRLLTGDMSLRRMT